jgi:hypothetical protein
MRFVLHDKEEVIVDFVVAQKLDDVWMRELLQQFELVLFCCVPRAPVSRCAHGGQ